MYDLDMNLLHTVGVGAARGADGNVGALGKRNSALRCQSHHLYPLLASRIDGFENVG